MNKYFDKIKSKYRYLTVFEKIISLNILVYIFTFFLKDIILDYFQLSSSVSFLLLNPWTILTYSFIHINIIDLIINMLILYYVSNSLGNIFDSKLPLKIFIYGIIFGGIFFIIFSDLFSINNNQNLIGASAGIRSLLIFLCFYLPTKKIRFAFWPVELKYIGFFIFSIDLLGLLSINSGGYISHIGGDLLGIYFYYNLYQSNPSSQKSYLDLFYSLFKKTPKFKYYKNKKQSKSRNNDIIIQKKIDVILDKISKSGYENLSKEEKDFLFKVGKK
jgi:membrane associated rhomboid family serine protease